MTVAPPAKLRRLATAVTIDLSLCKVCGICRAICPRDVFGADELGSPTVARPNACSVCFACEWHCPDFAIVVDYEDVPRSTSPRHTAASPSTVDAAAAGKRRTVGAGPSCGEDR